MRTEPGRKSRGLHNCELIGVRLYCAESTGAERCTATSACGEREAASACLSHRAMSGAAWQVQGPWLRKQKSLLLAVLGFWSARFALRSKQRRKPRLRDTRQKAPTPGALKHGSAFSARPLMSSKQDWRRSPGNARKNAGSQGAMRRVRFRETVAAGALGASSGRVTKVRRCSRPRAWRC